MTGRDKEQSKQGIQETTPTSPVQVWPELGASRDEEEEKSIWLHGSFRF